MECELEIIDVNAVIEVTQPLINILEIEQSPDGLLEVTDSYNTETLVFTQSPVIEVLEVAERGLPGDSAYQIAVNNGFVGTEEDWLITLQAGASIPKSESFLITPALEQSFVLAYTPTTNSLKGFLNGLREAEGAFNVSGNTVSFPFLDLASGDTITVDYRYTI